LGVKVLGSAINATGSRMPLNVPNGVAQKQSIYEAYKRSGLDPKEADYVELHATGPFFFFWKREKEKADEYAGTFVGDPIEANATGQIFAKDTPSMFGSIKGNIGYAFLMFYFILKGF
jgi:acyl transferase domain-containing protein